MDHQTDTSSVEELLTKCQCALPPSLKELPTMLKRYPPLAIFAIIFAVISAVPLLLFICFALSSFVFMSIGFLLVEGTLLAFGTCILVSALFFATVAALGVSASVWVVGFVVSSWRDLFTECSHYLETQLSKYLPAEQFKQK